MRGLIKWLGSLVILLVVILAGALAYLTLVLNPNDYKEDIELLAHEQGIPLRLKGDVSWQWYPNLGLSLQQVSLETPGQPLLMAESMSAAVAVAPLLQGDVAIKGIELHGVRISLLVDEQGRGNWEQLTSSQPQPAPKPESSASAAPAASGQSPSAEPAGADLAVAIEELVIGDALLSYENKAEQTKIQIDALNLTAQHINASGRPFTWQSNFKVLLEKQPTLLLQAGGTVAVDLKSQQVELTPLQLQVSGGDKPLSMTLNGKVNLDTMEPDVRLSVDAFDLRRWLQSVAIELPAMAAPDALNKLQLAARVQGLNGGWRLSDLALDLDLSHFSGSADISASSAVTLVLSGDQLDVDRYMAPPAAADTNTQQASATPKSGGAKVDSALPNTPLPLAPLKPIQAKVQLQLQQFKVQGLDMQEVLLKAKANKGLLTLEQLTAQFYGGSATFSGQLNARKPVATLRAKGQLQQVSLEPLLMALSEEQRISGKANISFEANTKGKSLRRWQQALQATNSVKVSELTVKELDIEKDFCGVAALLNQQPMPQLQWQGVTQLQDVDIALAVQGTGVTVQQLQAGVEDLRLKATGTGDYDKGEFDLLADVVVTGIANTERACQVRDRWRNRDLPLRCKGNLESLSAGTCKPDKDRIDDLLREELKDSAEAKVKTKLEDKLEEKLGPQVKDLLDGLFKR